MATENAIAISLFGLALRLGRACSLARAENAFIAPSEDGRGQRSPLYFAPKSNLATVKSFAGGAVDLGVK